MGKVGILPESRKGPEEAKTGVTSSVLGHQPPMFSAHHSGRGYSCWGSGGSPLLCISHQRSSVRHCWETWGDPEPPPHVHTCLSSKHCPPGEEEEEEEGEEEE